MMGGSGGWLSTAAVCMYACSTYYVRAPADGLRAAVCSTRPRLFTYRVFVYALITTKVIHARKHAATAIILASPQWVCEQRVPFGIYSQRHAHRQFAAASNARQRD
jgi:hypothetical protein